MLMGLAALTSFAVGVLAQGNGKPESITQRFFSHAQPADFAGDLKCADCHPEQTSTFAKSPHALYMHDGSLSRDRQGCEACHGPAVAHIASKEPEKEIIAYSRINAKDVIDACLRCHGDVMKKPHFNSEAHGRAGLSCISCHQIHPSQGKKNPLAGDRGLSQAQVFPAAKGSNPMLKAEETVLCSTCHKPQITEFRKNSHHPVVEGRMICSDCHSIHPTNADRLKQSKIKDKCVTCHAEVAGPFVYEHDPVAGWTGGGCLECHNPHGSNNPALLSSATRGLCAQCHTDKGGASHFPGQSCWASGCHVAVHGSNHDVRLLVK